MAIVEFEVWKKSSEVQYLISRPVMRVLVCMFWSLTAGSVYKTLRTKYKGTDKNYNHVRVTPLKGINPNL